MGGNCGVMGGCNALRIRKYHALLTQEFRMPSLLSVRAGVTITIAGALSMASIANAQDSKITYPKAKTVEQTDDYHGTKVPDPFRWLEDDARKSAEVKDWVEAENAVTFAYLKAIPEREAIKKRLTALWN